MDAFSEVLSGVRLQGALSSAPRVSLLVMAVEGGATATLPGEALPHVTSSGRIDDMSVVSFRTSDQMVFFAGDVVQNDLLKLAEVITEPLYRGLASADRVGARRRLGRSAGEDIYALALPEYGFSLPGVLKNGTSGLAGTPRGRCDEMPSAREVFHAGILYSRQPGNTDPDNDSTAIAPLDDGTSSLTRCERHPSPVSGTPKS